MTTTKLKPCPFCGGDALLHGSTVFWTACSKCRVSFPSFFTKRGATNAWATALQAELDRTTAPKCAHKNTRAEYFEEFPYGGQSHFTKMGTRCLDCGAEV